MPHDYSLSRYAAPETTSVTLAEAKLQLRQDESADDALITTLCEAADQHIESFLGRRLITQTWDYKRNSFPCRIELPYPPLVSVSSITYIDTNGTTQTLSTDYYAVDVAREPGRITLKYGMSWPSTQCIENAVTVRYVAGYGAASAVPSAIKAAAKLLIGHWYESREDVVIGTISAMLPQGAQTLLWPYRILEIP